MSCARCNGSMHGGWPQRVFPHAADCPIRLEEIEAKRAQRHHDVLCLVLKEQLRAYQSSGVGPMVLDDMLTGARYAANKAYPPPEKS